MAYKPKDQFFPPVVEGNVKLSGDSINLGVGEVAFVNISGGVKVLSDFTPLSSEAKLAIRMGEPNDNVSRSEDNKAISSIPFNLKDVVDIYVDAPDRAGILVDDFVIGYNGKDGSEIDLEVGENEVIDVTLSGTLMGMLGLPDSKHTAVINLTAPLEGVKGTDWTMHEIVENAYLELKNYKLPGNIPITDYVDVLLVNSENPETIPGTERTFYNLIIEDGGTQSDLGKVQAQYPDAEIKKVSWKEGKTTYSTIGDAPEVVAVGSLTIGETYVITSVGTADFTTFGAENNEVGTIFTATGAGEGLGTATVLLFAPYQPKADFVLKGCDDCPSGYSEIAQGFVYEVVSENSTDQTAAVQAIPGAEADSAVLNDTNGDTNTYSVVTDDALTDAEIAAFIEATEGAKEVNLIAEDVADLCASALPEATSWIEGETCNFTTETYTITVKDSECGESRLADIQKAYPKLTITEVADSEAGCQRTYQTTVETNLICEECDPIFGDVFSSEAPSRFEATSWEKAEKSYSADAKMGIRVRGKRASIAGNEFLRDDMFFFDGSVEISLAGGFPEYTNESYLAGTNDRFTVKYFSRKADAQNLGGNLRKYEEEAQMHFRGRSRYVGNNYGKIVSGQETRLEALAQYIIYSITVAPHKYVSNFQQPQNGAYTYHFIVPLGKQGDFEAVVNKLATATGLPQVQAVSK